MKCCWDDVLKQNYKKIKIKSTLTEIVNSRFIDILNLLKKLQGKPETTSKCTTVHKTILQTYQKSSFKLMISDRF